MTQSIQTPSSLPKSLSQQLEQLSCRTKLTLAKQQLEKLCFKFPRLVGNLGFKELDRIAAILDDDFVQQRGMLHLCKLAYSIAIMRKNLSQEALFLSSRRYYDVRIMPFSLHFTFGSKPILGILTHAYLSDKYEAFDEEHILLKIRKHISEAQLVKGSVYAFQLPKNGIKTLYFEVDKKSGLPFSPDEIKRLKTFLVQEIELCVEKLVPRIFMTRNEEEVLKNILTLSREVRRPSDSPEVMILLDQQTSQEAVFTIIVVQPHHKKTPDISEQFAKLQGSFSFFLERSQVVRYLKKKYPIKACVFRIHLPKDPSILRSDLSINFYLARQKICSLLAQVIGNFRDFNGGIILKQRETLSSFMEDFPELSSQNTDLLETFFHSISPIEAQTFLSKASLAILFDLFLKAQNFNLIKPSDYFLQFHQTEDELFVMIRLSDKNPKASLDQIFSPLQSRTITTTLSLQNSHFLGYLLSSIAPPIQEELKGTISQTLNKRKQSIESQKILKLGLEYTIVSLDPRIGGDQVSSLVLKMLFEGLMRENREGNIECGVAESVEISPDLKTYHFKLRKTLWSDGSMVTAFDFEYAWKKILSPSFKTPFAYLFYPIKNAQLAKIGGISIEAVGIQALDDLSLKIELKSPTPYFLELTAHTIYSPVYRLIDQLHPNWSVEEGSRYICNGAFQLLKNKPNECFEIAKNSFYWDAANIRLDRVSIVKMNNHQACERFQENNNYWVGDPLSMWAPHIAPSEKDTTVNCSIQSMFWYTFNSQKLPFNNKKMRQAFSLAFDRVKLASFFCTQPTFSPLPPSHSLIKHSPLSIFDPKAARILFNEALKELNLSKTNSPFLTIVYSNGSKQSQVAKMIKQSWEECLGIECAIQPLNWNDLFTKLTEGNYEVGCIAWLPWANDPMYTLNVFRDKKDPLNFPKWENRQYQEILSFAEKEVDIQKRQKYYLQAETLLLEESPITPICPSPFRALRKKRLKIKFPSPLMNFKWAYFD